MTISLNMNIVPLTHSLPLRTRVSQLVAEFVVIERVVVEKPLKPSVPQRRRRTPSALTPRNTRPNSSPEKNTPEEGSEMPTEEMILSQMTLPTHAIWRAWREKGESAEMTVLHVAGLCPFVPGVNGRVLLQESVTADQGHPWGGQGAKSGLLVLERLLVPPALGETETNPQQVNLPPYPWCYPWETAGESKSTQPLLITYHKEEKKSRSAQSPRQIPMTAPQYTHVTILPDGITIPIQG